MHGLKQVNIIFVETKDKENFEGVVMPSIDSKILVLKLENGYNIGIEKSKIKSVKVVLTGSKKEEKAGKAAVQNSKLKKILIFSTLQNTIYSKFLNYKHKFKLASPYIFPISP